MSESVQAPRPLSARYREDFAFPTIKDRLPVILTKVVDHVYRSRAEVEGKNGQVGIEDLKLINGSLSRLKNELQTDKPLRELSDTWEDAVDWDSFLAKERSASGDKEPSWFSSSWLYTECYFYRRIFSAVQQSASLKDLDVFGNQKQVAFTSSLPALAALGSYLLKICDALNSGQVNLQDEFTKFFQVSLWGNKCDLSISAGTENSQKDDSMAQLAAFREFLLVDDTSKVWQKLVELKESSGSAETQLDIVLDNSGFELFTDLCLLEFLVASGMAHKVIIHPKSYPWFVSDVTQTDLDWTLNQLESSNDEHLSRLGKLWKSRFADKTFSVFHHNFWTMPYEYLEMQAVAPDLYAELSKSSFILFKGDLNYRKLVRDRKWEHTVSFESAVDHFRPAPLCSLRTLKCDLVVGLKPGQAEEAQKKSDKWLISGDFGVIQFLDRLKE